MRDLRHFPQPPHGYFEDFDGELWVMTADSRSYSDAEREALSVGAIAAFLVLVLMVFLMARFLTGTRRRRCPPHAGGGSVESYCEQPQDKATGRPHPRVHSD